MVLTRRQEQLLHTPPPPAANGGQLGGEPSPATPAGAVAAAPQANGRALPLKSALKTGRKLRPSGAGEEESTPVGAGIKKRVRIHSSSNLVHEFTTSHSTDEAAWALMEYDEEEEEHESGSDSERGSADGTPDSGGSRRGRTRRRTTPESPSFLSLLLFGEGARGRGGARRGGRRRAGSGAWLGLLYTLAWMAASSALIFANKVLMVDHGFRFPFALTAMGQAASVLLALAASLLGLAPLRPPPSAEVAIKKLLPVAASFAASLFLGNVAYLGLSVAFINMLKAATPLVTLAVGLAVRLEAMSKLTLLSTALIAFGTAVATASEAGTTHFHWLSFLAFAGSVVFEGVRVVMTEKLLGQARYNVMEALVYLGPFTTAFLAAGAFAFEWDQGLATTGWALLRARTGDFATAALISFLVNLFCYLAIKHVSATSFKVAGCLKNVLVVWGGILQGDIVTSRELQGYGISLAGFVLFSAARCRRPAGAGHSGDSSGRGPPKKRQQ